MKLSKELTNILKNFSGINSNIKIEEGSRLRTRSTANNIFGSAVIDETFPQTFCIYDLSQFLATLSLFNEPELLFENDEYVTITEEGSRQKIRYHFAEEALIVAPKKDITMPETEIVFKLEEDQLQSLLKASSVLQSPHIKVVGNVGENIKIVTTDAENPSCNEYDVVVDVQADFDFEVYFATENLKLIQESYEVKISTKKISQFVGRDGNLVYYVAVEKNSKFGQ